MCCVQVAVGASLERFVGVLRHEGLGRDQLAKLDFIVSRGDQNKLEMAAVLTLHFGDFESGEYVSYHFHDVEHFLLDQSFTFDQPDQPATIRRAKLQRDTLTGEFRSEHSGLVGKLILSRKTPIAPKSPLIEPVWGEYAGKCDPWGGRGIRTKVQLYTYRSPADTSRVGNPFGAYRVRGFVGQDTGTTCIGDAGSRMCIWSTIYGASYNFYKGRLLLYGRNRNLTCQVTQNGLNCGGCALERVSEETAGPRTMVPPTSLAFFAGDLETNKSALVGETFEGEYTGYLHHEYLNAYQPVALNLLNYPVADGSGGQSLRMSAAATLSFGEETSPEQLTYRFKARSFPNPLLMGQFIFDRAAADVDAILQIQRLGNGAVSGTWFSQRFGRVGKFLLKKNGMNLPADAALIPEVSGAFLSPKWTMDLAVGLGATPPNTENPFFPLSFAGKVYLNSLGGPARTITGGSYDFYTGRIGIEAEGRTGLSRAFIGHRELNREMTLKTPLRGPLTTLPRHEPQVYREQGGGK